MRKKNEEMMKDIQNACKDSHHEKNLTRKNGQTEPIKQIWRTKILSLIELTGGKRRKELLDYRKRFKRQLLEKIQMYRTLTYSSTAQNNLLCKCKVCEVASHFYCYHSYHSQDKIKPNVTPKKKLTSQWRYPNTDFEISCLKSVPLHLRCNVKIIMQRRSWNQPQSIYGRRP